MARFQKGRKKTGGRKAGVRNKTTQRRIDAAERAIALAKAGGKRLAREVLEDFMELFSAIALTHQPSPPGVARNSNHDEARFQKYARLSVEVETALIDYQSPKLRALMVSPGLGQQQGNGNGGERISREELARRLEERGLPPWVFGVDVPMIAEQEEEQQQKESCVMLRRAGTAKDEQDGK